MRLEALSASTPRLPILGKETDTCRPRTPASARRRSAVLGTHQWGGGGSRGSSGGKKNHRALESLHLLSLQMLLTKPGRLTCMNLIAPHLGKYNIAKHTVTFYSMYITY